MKFSKEEKGSLKEVFAGRENSVMRTGHWRWVI
jgi:hypothetical protein